MAFSLPDDWVWDFWLADDGARFHMFYLHAPRSLGDANLRHRNARIGHAVSTDLRSWTPRPDAIGPGPAGSFDQTATWTGSVVKAPDGLWWMFYTGSSFLSADSNANIETIGVATSSDLDIWTKLPGPVLRADPRWYESLGTSSWTEEAWRDPWVFADPNGNGWHMLVTARINSGADAGRGVIGHAVSSDLLRWQARPPLSLPQAGFGHLEVPQIVEIEGRHVLVFCCNAPRLANGLAGQVGGIWTAPVDSATGPFAIERASLLADERVYAGRLVQDRAGAWNLMAFVMGADAGGTPGGVTDPMPVAWRKDQLALVNAMR